MTTSRVREYQVIGRSHEGSNFQAKLTHLTRYHAVLEIYDPGLVLCVSQAIPDFTISMEDVIIYSGRAVVGSLINTKSLLVCEVKLADEGFIIGMPAPAGGAVVTSSEFREFLNQWQRVYRVHPEFKLVITDMQSFLLDLSRWLDHVELEASSSAKGGSDRVDLGRIRGLCEEIVPAFDALHERLEEISGQIEPELRPLHQHFAKRHLHSLIMCSPFAHRTFHKPLGYAGDYEMVNMILREPLEGGSLYARALNNWFLSQWPAKAHRNRITYLKEKLQAESLRGARRQKPIQVLNLGCGPASEVLQFLAQDDLSEHVQFTLWDFNDETVERTGSNLEDCKRRFQRRTPIQIVKKSVHQVLKEGGRAGSLGSQPQFDFIYCAGLFDYLTDRTCKQVMSIFYNWLTPDGLLAITNVADCKPFRHMLEFLLDWHLIYRDTEQGWALIPNQANRDDCRVLRDSTQVNMMVEVRKPYHV